MRTSELPSDPTCSDLTLGNLAGPEREGERRKRLARDRVEGGIDLHALPAGTCVEARTKNSVYTIRVGEAGRILLAGHAEHCPEPTEVISVGAVLLTGAVCDGYLAPGMRMEFRVGTRRVFTSRLTAVGITTGAGA